MKKRALHGIEWRPVTLSKKEHTTQYTRTAGQYSPTTKRLALASYRTCTTLGASCISRLRLGVIYPTVQVINDGCFSLNTHDRDTTSDLPPWLGVQKFSRHCTRMRVCMYLQPSCRQLAQLHMPFSVDRRICV
jgi:hypothetical protein